MMNIFTYIKGADVTINAQIEKWRNKNQEYLRQFYGGDINKVRGTVFGDCISNVEYLVDMAIAKSENFRGVVDSNLQLQAGAIVKARSRYLLYIYTITNAPWNAIANQPESIRGAATSLMEGIVQESIELGYNGRVEVLPIPRAKSFYLEIGFIEYEDGYRGMKLTSDSAARFLRRQMIQRQNLQIN